MAELAVAIDWLGLFEPPRAKVEAMLAVFPTGRRRSSRWDSETASLGAAHLQAGDADDARYADPGGVAAVFDGRLDSSRELRAELGLPVEAGLAAVIVAGYRRWGLTLPSRLRGDFAFAVWDAPQRRLLAARDPLSVRPLYYASPNGRLLVASDPEQLLATGWVSPAPDETMVLDYLQRLFAEREATFFREVRRLRGGHALVATASSRMVTDYRPVDVPPRSSLTREENHREFRRLFFQAVRRRLDRDRPVVTQLSGGLDSSSITVTADRILSEETGICPAVVAAAALHPGLRCDESLYISAVKDAVRIPVRTWDGTASDALELEKTPLPFPGLRYVLSGGTEGDVTIAHELGARVILSGVGGDQLGTPHGALEDAVLEGRWGVAFRATLGRSDINLRTRARFAADLGRSVAPRWLRTALTPSDALPLPAWITPRGNHRGRPSSPDLRHWPWRNRLQRSVWHKLTESRNVFSMEFIQQHALRRGVEVRMPFMDGDLVRFALGIPPEHWPAPVPNERLHREALRDVLPDAIANRRGKALFSVAFAGRVRRQLPTIRRLMSSTTWAAERYVTQRAAQAELEAFENNQDPSLQQTWSVWSSAALEAWLSTGSGYTASRSSPN